MKTLILILTLAIAAAAQTVPCLVNDGTGWKTPAADTVPVKVVKGGQFVIPVSMPVAGRCVGSFAAFDDRDDLAIAVTDAARKYIKRPAADIEILVLDTAALQRRNAGQSFVAYWVSRSTAGSFDLLLRPGVYFFVISNKHSYLAPKLVNFTLGKTIPVP